MKTGFQVRATA